MSKHTPGPWFYIAPRDDLDPPIVQRGNSGGFSVLDREDQERAIADARLIAVAPDLLAALKDACLTFAAHGDQSPSNWLAAIAKAEGE